MLTNPIILYLINNTSQTLNDNVQNFNVTCTGHKLDNLVKSTIYHKILIISPGLIYFVQKALLGLFWGSLFSEGLIIGRNFTFQNGLGLGLYLGGLIFRRIFASEICGVYFQEGSVHKLAKQQLKQYFPSTDRTS